MSTTDDPAAIQTTLDDETTDEPRRRPSTLQWCNHCETYILRSNWRDHEAHDRAARDAGRYRPDPAVEIEPDGDDPDDPDGEDEDEIRQLGHYYEVRLSYSVDYVVRVAGYNERDAESRAKDKKLKDGVPAADAMHVHSETRELREVYEDDDEADDFENYDAY